MAATGPNLLAVPEAMSYLKLQDISADRDELLRIMLPGVDEVIEREVGPVAVRQDMTIATASDRGSAVLSLRNIRSIDAVINRRTDQVLSTVGMVADAGVLQYSDGRTLPAGQYVVTATVGMDPIPSSIKMAAFDVLEQAYKSLRREERPTFVLSYRAVDWLRQHTNGVTFA